MKKLAFLDLAVVAACNAGGAEETIRQEAPADATPEQIDSFKELESSTQQRWSWTQEGTSSVHLVGSRNKGALVVNARGGDPVYATLSLLAAHKRLFKMKAPATELAVRKSEVDSLGMTHTRFAQTVHGVPVHGAEVMAHFDAAGHVTSIDSSYVADLDLDVTPKLAAAEALAKAKERVLSRSVVDASTLESDEGELMVFADEGVAPRLAYRYKVRAMEAKEPAIWVTTVDASTGEILQQYDNLQTIQGQGVGFMGDTKQFEVTQSGNGFVLTDSSAGVQIRTLTARQAQQAPGQPITSTVATSWDTGVPGAGAAVDAHFNAIAVFKYYKERHQRNAIDGAGGAMLSTAHYGQNFENAAWDSVGMFYGDGGASFRPLSVSIDVVGHEFTHGVIEKTSNLEYLNQPGALNEAVADIMGAYVEHAIKPDPTNNWLLGESVAKQGSALRSMKNPNAVDNPQPAHMTQFVNTQQDNGGVHINSGIINNAAFLLTVGGTNPVSKTEVKFGIGWEKAEKLWYRANAQYFGTRTSFVQAAQGVMRAAQDLSFTSNEMNIVECAFKAVGINQGTCATITDPANPTPASEDPDLDSVGDSDGKDDSDDTDVEEEEEEEKVTKPKRRRMVTRQVSGCTAAYGAHGASIGQGALIALAIGLVVARRRKK